MVTRTNQLLQLMSFINIMGMLQATVLVEFQHICHNCPLGCICCSKPAPGYPGCMTPVLAPFTTTADHANRANQSSGPTLELNLQSILKVVSWILGLVKLRLH